MGRLTRGVPAPTRQLTKTLKSREDDFADRSAALDDRVSPPQVSGVDWAEVVLQRAAQNAGIHQLRNLSQEPMVLIHVGSPKERASEHQLPMDRQTLALEWDDVERVGIVDQGKRALRRQGVHDGGKMLIRRRKPGHVPHLGNPDSLQCLVKRAVVIDHLMSTHFLRPGDRVGREAVAITDKPVSRRASWVRIDPTPPAPLTTRIVSF